MSVDEWQAQAAEGAQIDVLFIDAAHDYEAVKKDIAAWVPLVRLMGVVAFHDYAKNDEAHYLHQDVKRAVDEWIEEASDEWGLLSKHSVDSLQVYQRKGYTPELEHFHTAELLSTSDNESEDDLVQPLPPLPLDHLPLINEAKKPPPKRTSKKTTKKGSKS